MGGNYYERMLECVADDQALPSLLSELAERTGATAAQLKVTNQRRDFIQSSLVGDFDQRLLEQEAEYQRTSPRTSALLAASPGQVIRDGDFISEAEIANDATYQQFLIPAQIGRVAGVCLAMSSDEVCGVGVLRAFKRGPFSDQIGETLKTAALELAPAIEFAGKLKQRRSGRVLDDIQDGIAAAVVDRTGRVVDRNSALEGLAADGRIALRQSGHLRLKSQEESRLERLLARTLQGGFRGKTAIRDQKDNSLLLVTLYRAPPMGAFLSLGSVVVTIEPVGARRSALDPEALSGAFGLTKAESEVAGMLFNGDSIVKVARTRSVTVNTVRSITKSIMRKTETSRQPELIALLAHLTADR